MRAFIASTESRSPAMIAELHKKAIQALKSTYTSLENGVSNADMGAAAKEQSDDEDAVAASPDEAPAEYREMVSDYFKAIGEMK